MTSRQISISLSYHFDSRRNLVIPNFGNGLVGGFEADMVILRDSGWAEEVEIKVSRADFNVEFRAKALKHRMLVEGVPTRVSKPYYSRKSRDPRDVQGWQDWDTVSAKPEFEKLYLRGGQTETNCYSGRDWSCCQPHLVNRYWFAMPFDLALKLESLIPEYAGLLSINLDARSTKQQVRVVKPAPRLNARKLEAADREQLYKSAYYRFWELRRRLEVAS